MQKLFPVLQTVTTVQVSQALGKRHWAVKGTCFLGAAVEGLDHSNTHLDSQRTATGLQTAHKVSFK